MRTELKNLEITQTDLKNLSGITSESYLDSPKNGILWKTIIWFFPALFVSVILVVILFSILEALGRTYDEWVALLSFVFFVLAFPLARYAALDSPENGKNGILRKTILWLFPALFVAAILVSISLKILEVFFGDILYDEWELLLSSVLAFPLARYAAKNIGTKASKIYQNSSYYKKTEIEAFLSLKIEVERFNNLIKAIDVNDQLEEAGNKGMDLNNRNKIIEALELARKDLVRALKTEKILRDNKDIIINNPDLFANNLSNLQALQINDKATEYGQLLNQALQIAVEVQEEMRKLKNQH
jgi:NACalpha-BTF3-like transcription factor